MNFEIVLLFEVIKSKMGTS